MGAFEGSLTFKTFFVDGEPAAGFQDGFLTAIRERAFVELTPEDEEDRRTGWVCIERPLDTAFTRDKVFYNQYIALALRIDRWALPSALLKAYLDEATREYLEKNDTPRLGRREKDELKDLVTKKLKRRLVPSMKVIDCVWDTASGIVRFWTHSAAVCEEFQELFEDTFGLRLVPDSPYTAAVDLDVLDDDQLERFVQLEPEWFADVPEAA